MRIPTAEQQERINDTIHNRFYDRLSLYDVYKWLDNFEDDEIELAVSVFEKLEYYRESDLLNILSNQFENNLLPEVSKMGSMNVNIRFIPLGRPGKSGYVVEYMMKNLLKNYSPKSISQTFFHGKPDEIDAATLTDKDVLIFLDDIIGSGDTFDSAVSLNKKKFKKDGSFIEVPNEDTIGHLVKENSSYQIAILSCFIMDKGQKHLKDQYPYIFLYGETRVHAFQKSISPFGGYLRMKQIREFCYKYGDKLAPQRGLGYSNCQALLLFDHAVPNNTLPIVWADKYEENGIEKYWIPLIPRDKRKRQEMAYQSRMDAVRWTFKLSKYFGLDEDDPQWDGIIQKKNIQTTVLLRCLNKHMPLSVIANEMGITFDDLNELLENGVKLELWNDKFEISSQAKKLLEETKNLFKRREHDSVGQLVDDRNYMYVPETFMGKS